MEVSDKNKSVKISIVVLITLGLFLFAFILYILGSNQKMFVPTYNLNMFVENAQGLQGGSYVTLAGVKVGVVGKMDYMERDSTLGIKVQLRIERTYAKNITSSSYASVETKGILGSKYVNITLGKSAEKPLTAGDFIESQAPSGATEVIRKAAAAVDNFQGTLANLDRLSQSALEGHGVLGTLVSDTETKKKLMDIIDNWHTISELVAAGKGSAGQLIVNENLYNSMHNTASGLNEIVQRINRGEGNLGQFLSDNSFFAELREISSKTDSILTDIQNGGTVGKLLTEKELYDKLLALATSLNELAQQIKDNPDKFFKVRIF